MLRPYLQSSGTLTDVRCFEIEILDVKRFQRSRIAQLACAKQLRTENSNTGSTTVCDPRINKSDSDTGLMLVQVCRELPATITSRHNTHFPNLTKQIRHGEITFLPERY